MVCLTIAIIVFIIALILGVSWAGDLASGLAGLFGTLATLFLIAILIIAGIAFVRIKEIET